METFNVIQGKYTENILSFFYNLSHPKNIVPLVHYTLSYNQIKACRTKVSPERECHSNANANISSIYVYTLCILFRVGSRLLRKERKSRA